MINELSLLKLNPESASTKQKIIDILSNEWPLSAKLIYERLQKQYGSEISYQATHKTLKELEREKIIDKNNEGYLMNINWIQKSKKSLEKVEKKYIKNKKIKIPENFANSIEIEFDTTTDLCVSMAELLLSRQLARDKEDLDFICTMEYGWWPFKLRFDHFVLLGKMMKENPNSKNIIRTKTPFGEWIGRQYKKINAVSAPIGIQTDFEDEIFIQGDYIIEVKFNLETKKIIEKYYKKWHNLEEMFMEFGLKEEPKIHATMHITKNPEMANFMRKQLEKVFEVEK